MAIHYLLATEEQKELAELAGEITRSVLTDDVIEECEKANDGLGRYPWEAHRALSEAGFFAMAIPEELGGLGLNNVSRALIIEEIARVDAGFAFSFRGMGEKWNLIRDSHLPQEKKDILMAKMVAGELGGSFCLTEPDAGSDSKAIKTHAEFDEKTREWVINGTKCFITNGGLSDIFGVFAWTDKTLSPSKGITCFFVENDRPGFEVAKRENKMGFHLSETNMLSFTDVRVPEDHIVGELGTGFTSAMATLETARPFNSVFAIGCAQHAIDIAVKYANERKTFGKPIIKHEAIGFKLADMQAKLDSARAFVYYCMELGDRGIKLGRMANEAKYYAADQCFEVCLDAMQVLGGYGYMKEYNVERLMRDCKLFSIMGGTTEIQQLIASRTMMDNTK